MPPPKQQTSFLLHLEMGSTTVATTKLPLKNLLDLIVTFAQVIDFVRFEFVSLFVGSL